MSNQNNHLATAIIVVALATNFILFACKGRNENKTGAGIEPVSFELSNTGRDIKTVSYYIFAPGTTYLLPF